MKKIDLCAVRAFLLLGGISYLIVGTGAGLNESVDTYAGTNICIIGFASVVISLAIDKFNKY